jgi:hypothetical protein
VQWTFAEDMTAGDAQCFIRYTHVSRFALAIMAILTVCKEFLARSNFQTVRMKLIITTSLSLHPETLRPHVSRTHTVDRRLRLRQLISVLSDARHIDAESQLNAHDISDTPGL